MNKNFDILIEDKDIKKLVLNDEKYLNLQLKDSDFEKILDLVSNNPREKFLIHQSLKVFIAIH